MTKFAIGLVTFTLVVTLPLASFGCGLEAWNFPYPMVPGFSNGNWTFGEVFVANQDIRVSYLGYYTENFPPNFLSPHPVGLFDANGNLLRSTIIDNHSYSGDPYPPIIGGGGQREHFAYNWIPQIILQAGQTYVLEGVSGADPYAWSYDPIQVYLPITVLVNNWVLDNGLNFNGTSLVNDVPDGYWGPDFGESPEPGSLLLLGSGMLGIVGFLRRKLNF